MKKFLNINTILIGVVLLLGIFGMFYLSANKTKGDMAIVQVESSKGERQRLEIDLSKNETHHIHTNYEVTLEVVDGAIAFVDSQCPDKLCEGYGRIQHDGEFAACLPAGVIITINEVG